MALLIQARHLFYGISMLDKFKGTGWKKFFLIFGMCDETFSVNYTAKIPEGVDKGWFMLWVTFLNQFYWVSAATTGGLIGSLLKFDTSGISFVMTAMFVVIFLEQWLKKKSCFFTYGNCRVGHLPDLLSCRLLHAANDGDYRSFACTFPEKIRTCGDLNYDDYTTDYHDRFMYRRNDAHALPAICHL